MTELQTIITRLQELQAKLPEKPKPATEFTVGQKVYVSYGSEYMVISCNDTQVEFQRCDTGRTYTAFLSETEWRSKDWSCEGPMYRIMYYTLEEVMAHKYHWLLETILLDVSDSLDTFDRRLRDYKKWYSTPNQH